MNMKQLKYVLVLADEGSFAKAADALGISQPSLSQYVKKIEQQVGQELFDRSGGDVRLTDAGRVYADAGKRILEIERQMQNSFSDIAGYRTGSVVVGTSPYRSAGMMPRIVRRFQEIFPGMQVVIEEMTSAELAEAAGRGRFDLCLTVSPANGKLFSWEKVADEELVLAVPASFPILQSEEVPGRRYPVIDASQIDGCSFIMITEAQVMQKTLENICYDYEISVRRAAVVKSLEAEIAMVREGVGMALVPTGIEAFCSGDEVRYYSFRQNLPRREVIAMWRKDKVLNRAARALLDVMKELSD